MSKIRNKKGSNKKLSLAAAIQQAHEGVVDLESPESLLTQVNMRSLLNKNTFLKLPPQYQYKLVQLLPQVDLAVDGEANYVRYVSIFNCLHKLSHKMIASNFWRSEKHISFYSRLSQSALNNEFLTKACHEWKERLLRGDFTSESLQRAKVEIEKDKSNVDPWKVIIFELFYWLPSSQITRIS